MGNISECKCKCKENKKEGELDLPNTKANINEIKSPEFKQIKNLNLLFKKNPKIEKNLEEEELSEIKINEEDNNFYNFKIKTENEKRTRIGTQENSFKKRKLELNEKINLDLNSISKRDRNKKKNIIKNPKKNKFFFNRTKTFIGTNKLNYKNELTKTNNSNTERENSFLTQISKFQNNNIKNIFEKYHLNCIQSMKKIPIKTIINNINLLYNNNDQEIILFKSELNILQFSGQRIIHKKYFNRFLISTKKEIKIFASKEKFITLQNPIQTFFYNQIKKSYFVEFENEKKIFSTFEYNNKKNYSHFLIYFNNETFQIFSSLQQDLIEKWISLINYLIEQNDTRTYNQIKNQFDEFI